MTTQNIDHIPTSELKKYLELFKQYKNPSDDMLIRYEMILAEYNRRTNLQ